VKKIDKEIFNLENSKNHVELEYNNMVGGNMKKRKEIIFIVSESKEGGYEAEAPGFSIFTQGETIEELKEMIKDAIKCHFEEDKIPEIVNLHIVKDEVLTL